MNIPTQLIQWYLKNKRELPWRNTTDPYRIWLSEVILQQTRIEQGLQYYKNILRKFPNVFDMSNASEDEVLKQWQGLGYYSRARNMHNTAKIVVKKYGGSFPENYHDLLTLKGVGEYTAAAIASIAFNKSHAVVDGNVIRVITRLFGISDPVDKSAVKTRIKVIAERLIRNTEPATYNQAIMEYGALVCTPLKPKCNTCVLKQLCKAYKTDSVSVIPVKSIKTKIRNRYFSFFVLSAFENNIFYYLLQKRTHQDIWQNLFEFPLLEKTRHVKITPAFIRKYLYKTWSINDFEIKSISHKYNHKLSHQNLTCFFIEIIVPSIHIPLENQQVWVSEKKIKNYAIPRLIESYINHKQIIPKHSKLLKSQEKSAFYSKVPE